jgi:integral membrane protein
MLKSFRKVSLAEGCSLLVLLLVAMPLKYFFDFPQAVKVVGWIHGVLFIVYVVMLLMLEIKHRWSFFFLTGAFLASLLPFGTFILDKYLREKEAGEK